jgi:hypothetical protein
MADHDRFLQTKLGEQRVGVAGKTGSVRRATKTTRMAPKPTFASSTINRNAPGSDKGSTSTNVESRILQPQRCFRTLKMVS